MKKQERYIVYFPAISMGPSTASYEDSGSLYEIYAQPHGIGEDPTEQIPDQRAKNDKTPDPALPPSAPQAKQSDQTRMDIYKGRDPVAAQLYQTGLFEPAAAAANKARKVGLKIPIFALYQKFFKRQAYINRLRLHLEAAKAPEGESAELALALALLLAASRASQHLVIATGRLGGQPSDNEVPDVDVLHVGKLPEKLRLIEWLASNNKLPGKRNRRDPVWLFTPTRLDKNEPVNEESLPEIKRLRDLGITVVPVKTLREAANRLEAQYAHCIWQDWAFPIGILGILGIIFLFPFTPHIPISPTLGIKVIEGQSQKKLEEVASVKLQQKLVLNYSPPLNNFRYLFTLDGKGEAYIFPLRHGLMQETLSIVSEVSPPTFITLMLVANQSLSEEKQKNLVNTVTSLSMKPELPKGVRYHFNLENCGPINAPEKPAISMDSSGRGPPIIEPSTLPVTCDVWAEQLLKTLQNNIPGVQVDGYAFQLDKY